MAAMTLAEARTEVRNLVDDTGSDRWTDAQVDIALKTQISACINEYTSLGGSRFDEEVNGTTSGASNSLDLSSYDPVELVGVSVKIGSNWYPVKQRRRRDRGAVDSTTRDLYIVLIRTPGFATSDSDPLLTYDGTTAMLTWNAFDSWVCAEAAAQLLIQDDELSRGLTEHKSRLRTLAVQKLPAVTSARFPRRSQDIGIDYIWDENTQTVSMVRGPSWLLYEAS